MQSQSSCYSESEQSIIMGNGKQDSQLQKFVETLQEGRAGRKQELKSPQNIMRELLEGLRLRKEHRFLNYYCRFKQILLQYHISDTLKSLIKLTYIDLTDLIQESAVPKLLLKKKNLVRIKQDRHFHESASTVSSQPSQGKLNQMKTKRLFTLLEKQVGKKESIFTRIMEGFEEELRKKNKGVSVECQSQKVLKLLKEDYGFVKNVLSDFFLIIYDLFIKKYLPNLPKRRYLYELDRVVQNQVSLARKTLQQILLILSLQHFPRSPPHPQKFKQVDELIREVLRCDFKALNGWLQDFIQGASHDKLEKKLLQSKQFIIQDIQSKVSQTIQICTDDFLSIFCSLLLKRFEIAPILWIQHCVLDVQSRLEIAVEKGQLSWLWSTLDSSFLWLQENRNEYFKQS